MFKKDLLKDWTFIHLPSYIWYLDCPYDTIIMLECQHGEKFDEGNLEQTISTNTSFRGRKQSHNAKRVRKTKK
jgi:hypothetical protein